MFFVCLFFLISRIIPLLAGNCTRLILSSWWNCSLKPVNHILWGELGEEITTRFCLPLWHDDSAVVFLNLNVTQSWVQSPVFCRRAKKRRRRKNTNAKRRRRISSGVRQTMSLWSNQKKLVRWQHCPLPPVLRYTLIKGWSRDCFLPSNSLYLMFLFNANTWLD